MNSGIQCKVTSQDRVRGTSIGQKIGFISFILLFRSYFLKISLCVNWLESIERSVCNISFSGSCFSGVKRGQIKYEYHFTSFHQYSKVYKHSTIRKSKNNDSGGLFSENALSYKTFNNFRAASSVQKNCLEICRSSHIPRTDNQNCYFCTI